ncbi:3-hydroxybutyryl-CoA dehydrogenase/3-hydroxybutyryl-CoA dehydratase [mine drainage metagenome]|uniref:3-hydroxybutyryl-CoA dehydrogenase/3-hydroxybutyryl-CoA dehydratase n=1 Tax=mine drainage metagenome TaxID=410659 RepID=T1BP47_9ZZZZ
MEGKVARIEIRNGKNNLLNSGVLNELDRVIESLWNNKEVYVIVIAGAGDIFSAGAELTQFIPGGMDFIEYSRRGERLFRKLSEIPKITIAEMKGYVLGGGFELSLNCDIRVSTPETVIGFPEVTIGLLPGWTGTQRLPKLIGMSRATHYILTGERFDGNVAFNLGIVTKLFPKNDIKSKTMEFAKELSEKVSPISAALSKRLINKGSEMSMDNGLEMEAISMGVLYSTEDFKEGISAFIQKRKPEFKFK